MRTVKIKNDYRLEIPSEFGERREEVTVHREEKKPNGIIVGKPIIRYGYYDHRGVIYMYKLSERDMKDDPEKTLPTYILINLATGTVLMEIGFTKTTGNARDLDDFIELLKTHYQSYP